MSKMTDRNAARSKVLKGREPEFKLVEFEGDTFAVRRPNVGTKGDVIFNSSEMNGGTVKVDPFKFQINALVACLYTVTEEGKPGVPVFEAGDIDALREQEAGGIVDALGPICAQAVNGALDVKEAAKNG